MDIGKPHVVTDLECPVHKAQRHVEFSVNVFREPDQKGLEVAACSEFPESQGTAPCGQMCIHSPEARSLRDAEATKHREDLAQIGQNVLG